MRHRIIARVPVRVRAAWSCLRGNATIYGVDVESMQVAGARKPALVIGNTFRYGAETPEQCFSWRITPGSITTEV